MTSPEVLPPRPAATLVLLRAAPEGCEVLLLRRKSELAFYGGAWVFPGGGIDAADHAEGSVPAHELPHDAPPPLAARNAALRELREEAGLSLPADAPICFSRWITPPGRTRRFDTWFFVALAPEHTAAVQLDAGEVDAFRWMTPSAALQARARREIELPPPTFVTLTLLAQQPSAQHALQALQATAVRFYAPHPCVIEAGRMVYLYTGDAGYEARDPLARGARHRLTIDGDDWHYDLID